MARRKNHNCNSRQPIAWPDVWKKIQGIVTRLNAPDGILDSVLTDETEWWIKGDNMYLSIPDNLRDYIELNMEHFKPVLWPFLLSHNCTKLIYKTKNHGTQKH